MTGAEARARLLAMRPGWWYADRLPFDIIDRDGWDAYEQARNEIRAARRDELRTILETGAVVLQYFGQTYPASRFYIGCNAEAPVPWTAETLAVHIESREWGWGLATFTEDAAAAA